MDAKRLIELARDCGMFVTTEMRWQIERWERLAAAVTDEIATPAIVVEREACAKMCEQLSHIGSENQLWMRDRCVAAIRSRSNAALTGAEGVRVEGTVMQEDCK